jgi:hypothetical protein
LLSNSNLYRYTAWASEAAAACEAAEMALGEVRDITRFGVAAAAAAAAAATADSTPLSVAAVGGCTS